MSNTDKAIENFKGFIDLHEGGSPDCELILEALQQANKDREDARNKINELCNIIIDLKIKYEPQLMKDKLEEIKELLEL